MFRRVAIIGGGAAGAALLNELVDQSLERRLPGPVLHLDWFTGGHHRLARGVAYGTMSPRHLLDVRAASMSMFAGKPHGFLEFAQARDPTVGGADFLPRRLYGDYLEAEAGQTLQRALRHGIDLRLMELPVDALVPESDGVTVVCGEDSSRVEAAVLALGAVPPQPLAGVSARALDSGRYMTDPWRALAGASDDPAPCEVALIGTGPTAVDAVLELSVRWPNARFTALSPHGRLPEAHLPRTSVPPDDAGQLVEAMHVDPSVRHWLRLLREAIDDIAEWRVVIDSLRMHTPGLWMRLPEAERARFLRHARWAWERARHRMPPQVAERMQELERSGRLQRRRGRVRAVDRSGERLELRLSGTHGGPATLVADQVIQAIGQDTDVRRTPHRLLSQLLTNRHIEPDPLGLGIKATPDGQLCHDGKPWPRLFGIGSLLRGTLWECNAMPEIRQHARALATRLLVE